MEILDVKDQPDGSAILKIDMSQEEMRLFMEVGLNKILADYIEEIKNAPIGEGTNISEQEKGIDK
jgi:hypothetical protein